MLKIFADVRFEKHLTALRKAGKKAEIAAEKVSELIVSLFTQGSLHLHSRILTKKGEARIPGCVKFDLGSGYRLVCLHCGDHLYLLFVGTHDESDRWIENNREIRVRQIAGRCRPVPSTEGINTKNGMGMEDGAHDLPENPNEHFPDDPLMDDRILKAVFGGLISCGTAKLQAS